MLNWKFQLKYRNIINTALEGVLLHHLKFFKRIIIASMILSNSLATLRLKVDMRAEVESILARRISARGCTYAEVVPRLEEQVDGHQMPAPLRLVTGSSRDRSVCGVPCAPETNTTVSFNCNQKINNTFKRI